jgi:anthranilate phosphoribosyltransferase
VNGLLDALCAQRDLTAEQAEALFRDVVAGALSEPLLAGLLVALKAKGETPAEIAGAARALRATTTPTAAARAATAPAP